MEISPQIGRPHLNPSGIGAEPFSGAGAPPKGSERSLALTITKAPAGIGPTDGTKEISPIALEKALQRDDDLGNFVNLVLGS